MSDDFEIAYGRRLIEEIARRAPKLRLIFRQTHSQIVAQRLDGAQHRSGDHRRRICRALAQSSGVGRRRLLCLVDPRQPAPRDSTAISLDEFVAREHILVSSGGFIGITDEGLAALGLSRRVCASTTPFCRVAAFAQGQSGGGDHSGACGAGASPRSAGLALLPCPLALPRYPIELGWRTSTQLDPVVLKVREAIVASFT